MAAALPTLSEMLTPTLLFSILAVVAVCVLIFHSTAEMDQLYNIPGPPRYPLIGSMLSLPSSGDTLQGVKRWCQLSPGGIVHVTFAGMHAVVLYTPEAAEPILSSRRHLDKGINYDHLRPWLGDGLLTSTGAKWFTRRKLITPAFHFGILDQFLEVMNEQSAVLVDRLAAAGPDPVNVWPLISDATLEVICETAMGVGISAQSGASSEYKTAIKKMAKVTNEKSVKPWLRNGIIFWLSGLKQLQDDALQVLHTFTKSVIEKRRHMLETDEAQKIDKNGPNERPAFLDILLSEGEGGVTLSDEEIAEETATFMFEGHDTTASGISWALYNFARFPHVQEKIHEEIDSVFGDSAQTPSREDLSKLKYLECAIKESIRVHSPVAFMSRTLTENVAILGYNIPKGTDAIVFPCMVHYDKRHWKEPERFDPDRFLPENSSGRHPYSYVPFSAGPRNCIGQRYALLEMKAVLVALLRRFRLSSSQEYSENMLHVNLTLQSHGPLEIQFEPR